MRRGLNIRLDGPGVRAGPRDETVTRWSCHVIVVKPKSVLHTVGADFYP
jgi:hypothetical protein